jgi:hypothetical protein
MVIAAAGTSNPGFRNAAREIFEIAAARHYRMLL